MRPPFKKSVTVETHKSLQKTSNDLKSFNFKSPIGDLLGNDQKSPKKRNDLWVSYYIYLLTIRSYGYQLD